MKSIPNKTTKIPGEEGRKMTYAELAKLCMQQTPQSGFTFEDMRKRLGLTKKLDQSDGSILLEDAEYSDLKSIVLAFKWPIIHEDAVAFWDDFEGATTVSIEKVKEGKA